MSRLSATFLLCTPLLCLEMHAQGPTAPLWPTEVIGESSGGFTFSVRMLGEAKVTFRDIGGIPSVLDSGDLLSEATRVYHDGFVQRDTRFTNDGLDLPDDGYTQAWSMLFADQVLADQSGIAFHNHSTIADGSTLESDSGNNPGVDMELSRRFGGFGRRMSDNRRTGSWGGFVGFGLTDINAKEQTRISATLRTISDTYSLDGATAPTGPYTSPSTETVTVIGTDGTPRQVVLNTNTLLVNRPYTRTETLTPGGAEIDGFWQVKGAYFTGRAGVWARWHVSRQFSIRASVGASLSVLGVHMRYDERLAREENAIPYLVEIRQSETTKDESHDFAGLFGSLDFELWLTRRTGLFASVSYENVSRDLSLTAGGRTADLRLTSGTGFRLGFTTLF